MGACLLPIRETRTDHNSDEGEEGKNPSPPPCVPSINTVFTTPRRPDNHRYYRFEPVNIHIQSLLNNIQEKNWLITTKKRVGVNYHHFVVTKNG